MSGNFLTPTALWKNFKTDGEVKAEIIAKTVDRDLSVIHLRISGKKTADGEVGIYATLTHKAQVTLAPAIVLVQDFNTNEANALSDELAEKGYVVLAVDIAGATDFNIGKTIEGVEKPYTLYPESLSYANYDKTAEDKSEIAGDASATCWYEWARVVRYAVEYLKTQSLVEKIGIIGIGGGATPVWQVVSDSCGISCAVIVANAGWKGYRGIDKFGDTPEPQFSDDALKYIAGIEPQAYAAHVKCPLMFLAPTNSPDYDIDRSYDTVSRISAKIYAAADYSVGERRTVGVDCFNEALVFLDAMLIKDAVLPKPLSVKSAVAGKPLQVEVSPDKTGLKDIAVYFAEGETLPALRAWEKVSAFKESENGAYLFDYTPYAGSKTVYFFARAEYDNGMRICSGVACKKMDESKYEDVKQRVLYSSRFSVGANGFYTAGENVGGIVFKTDKNSAVTVKNGPMDITGLFCPTGIVTFKINAEKYKPLQGALLMCDVFVKGGGDFKVNAIADYFGERTVYTAVVKLFGGLWQNVKIEINNFKTAQGLALKTYDNIEALEFSADSDFLINNILWV